MTDLTPFAYGDQAVRTLTIHGEPWFVLSDLCSVLDLSNVGNVLARLADDMKGSIRLTDGTPGNPNRAIVSEAGMYEVVIRSDKPEAVAFRRWVTSVVLPEIRKTGSYGTPKQLTPDEIVAQALQITVQRVEALTATVETQRARLALVEPKAAAFDRWLSSNVDYAVAHVAKALAIAGVPNIGRNRLFEFLSESRWAFRDKAGWQPYQTSIESKRLAVKLGTQLNTRTGDQFATVTLRITPKGAARLAELLGALPEVVAEALASTEDVAA